MKKTIYKLFFAWQFDKEEKWLNECSAKGLHLCDVGVCRYTFEEGKPGEYTNKIELLKEWPTHPESVAYIRFLEDTGVEMVGSLLRWVYFRKKSDLEAFDLYSDLDSRIEHLNRITMLFLPFIFLEFSVGLSNLIASDSTNKFVGMLCVLLGCLICHGTYNIHLKKQKLIKERMIHE